MFSVEVLIFRAISPQSPIKIKSLSLKQNIFMQKKVAVCSNGHPRAVCWAGFLEQLSCRCGGGLCGLSAQPALLGMSAGGEGGEHHIALGPSCSSVCPTHGTPSQPPCPSASSAGCPSWWGWVQDRGPPAVSLSLGWAGPAEEWLEEWPKSRVRAELSRGWGPS